MARLSIRGPLSATRVHELTDDVATVGRATTNTIQIESPGTSREHCKIEKTATGYRVVDSGSRNGTKINGTKADSHDLMPGDVITVGKHTLTFDPREDGGQVDNLATMTLADGAAAPEFAPPPEQAPGKVKKDDKVLRALMGFPQGDAEVTDPGGGGALKYVIIALVGLLVVGGLAALLILKRIKKDKDTAPPADAPTPAATSTP
jgi:predicted component of type VI protein secretion system